MSTVGCKDGEVNVYDSLYYDIDNATKVKIEKYLLHPLSSAECLLFQNNKAQRIAGYLP